MHSRWITHHSQLAPDHHSRWAPDHHSRRMLMHAFTLDHSSLVAGSPLALNPGPPLPTHAYSYLHSSLSTESQLAPDHYLRWPLDHHSRCMLMHAFTLDHSSLMAGSQLAP